MLNTRHMQYKIDVKCRDLHNFELFDKAEIEQFIQYLCIKLSICILYIYKMQILY